MKNIIIVCAGTYGREVYNVICRINQESFNSKGEIEYNILGFIDDNTQALEGSSIEAKVLGAIRDWNPIGDEVYALGVAFPSMKKKIAEPLIERGCRFETLIAPWSIVSDDCVFGKGCFISANMIGATVVLGDFVNINGSMICPGSVIEDYSTTTGFSVVENAHVGKSVFVGSHAVIQAGVYVGDNAQISVGSIVCEDVPSNATVFGVPAKPLA